MFLFFFFNDTATTEIYTLSLHDALPIFAQRAQQTVRRRPSISATTLVFGWTERCKSHKTVLPGWPSSDNQDRKSTRLNSSHSQISYAVFCLKKKKNNSLRLCTLIAL